MGGGGKGGSQSSSTTVTIPPWLKEPAERNIKRAETAQKIGYMPYYGPDIAAFNPTQKASFAANIGAAEAFGLLPQGSLAVMEGMAPEPQTFEGGIQAYSSGDLFDQALAELEQRRPGQVAQYNKLFVNPLTGAAPAVDQEGMRSGFYPKGEIMISTAPTIPALEGIRGANNLTTYGGGTTLLRVI